MYESNICLVYINNKFDKETFVICYDVAEIPIQSAGAAISIFHGGAVVLLIIVIGVVY